MERQFYQLQTGKLQADIFSEHLSYKGKKRKETLASL